MIPLALSGYMHFFKIAGISSALIFQLLFLIGYFKKSINYFYYSKVLSVLLSFYIILNLYQSTVSEFSFFSSLLLFMRRILPILLISVLPVLIKSGLNIAVSGQFNKQVYIQGFFIFSALLSFVLPCQSWYGGICFLSLSMPSHISFVSLTALIVLIYSFFNFKERFDSYKRYNFSKFILLYLSHLNIYIYIFLGVQSGTRSFVFSFLAILLIFLLFKIFNLIKNLKLDISIFNFSKSSFYFYSFITALLVFLINKINIKVIIDKIPEGILNRVLPSLFNPSKTLFNDERIQNWDFYSIFESDNLNTLLFGKGIGSKLGDWNGISIYDSFYNLIIVDYGIAGALVTLSILIITLINIMKIIEKKKLFESNIKKEKQINYDLKKRTIFLLFIAIFILSIVNEVLFLNGGANIFISAALLISIL